MKQKIRNYLDENVFLHLLNGSESLSDDDSLMEAGVVDSTSVLDLVQWLETDFGITIPDEDITPTNLDSITKIEAYVRGK